MQEPKSCDLPLVDTPIKHFDRIFSQCIIAFALEKAKKAGNSLFRPERVGKSREKSENLVECF